MDVHPPHEPIHTWRAFFIHLITITIGLLIALGLEGLVEMVHHHNLVNEARADIRSEMQSNQKKIKTNIEYVHADEQRIAADIKALLLLRDKQEHPGPKSLDYTFEWESLSDSAWKTAASSGAFNYLDFETERSLAGVYTLQDDIVAPYATRLVHDHLAAPAPALIKDEPAKASKEEIQLALQRSIDLARDLYGYRQILSQLDQAYTEELAKLN